jgi:hypothetical protein
MSLSRTSSGRNGSTASAPRGDTPRKFGQSCSIFPKGRLLMHLRHLWNQGKKRLVCGFQAGKKPGVGRLNVSEPFCHFSCRKASHNMTQDQADRTRTGRAIRS